MMLIIIIIIFLSTYPLGPPEVLTVLRTKHRSVAVIMLGKQVCSSHSRWQKDSEYEILQFKSAVVLNLLWKLSLV